MAYSRAPGLSWPWRLALGIATLVGAVAFGTESLWNPGIDSSQALVLDAIAVVFAVASPIEIRHAIRLRKRGVDVGPLASR